MAKTALITGITGQDGSYLAELLLEKGYEIYGMIRRLSTPNFTRVEHIADRITLLEGDLTDQSSLNIAMHTAQPDEVYNLAAQSSLAMEFSSITSHRDGELSSSQGRSQMVWQRFIAGSPKN